MSPPVACWHVARRELALEARTRESAGWLVPVGAAVVLLVGLGAGPDRELVTGLAPTAVWLVVVLATALVGVSTVRAERDEGCWWLLRGMVPDGAVLVGKLVAAWLLLASGWLLTAGAAAAVLSLPLTAMGTAGGLLGTLGLATVAVLVGCALGDVTRRVGLALVLLLPLSVPLLLAGVQLMTTGGARWLVLMAGYDAVVLAAAWATFPALAEE